MELDKSIALLGAALCVVAVVVGLVAGVLASRWERNIGHDNKE